VTLPPPLAMIAELTHRCPLQCPYCSNPLDLLKAADEKPTDFWAALITEAAQLGVLQIHFSGGEPTARRDLPALIAHATALGIYTNLITSAVLLDEAKLGELARAGLAHVQISIQGANAESADRIGNYRNGHEKKLAIARLVPVLGMSLTINAVVHRQNLHELPEMIELAASLGADRLEIAHVQYHGWALRNRAALMPTREALRQADAVVAEQREKRRGSMAIDYVIPDYYADTPKICMGGWGQKLLIVAPDGRVLPCHAAETIPHLAFQHAGAHPLREIWETGPAFTAFRGTGWMREPCASCAFKELDFGGCRCQALALSGDARATDPACHRAPDHENLQHIAADEAGSGITSFHYRRYAHS
jgi:pyrroloquinoline quinone biosynthesis protein E